MGGRQGITMVVSCTLVCLRLQRRGVVGNARVLIRPAVCLLGVGFLLVFFVLAFFDHAFV